MDTCSSYNQNGNKIIEIEIEDKVILNVEKYELDILQKIVANMFKKYKDDLSNEELNYEHSIDEQKEIISKFERVIKCIRYQVIDIRDLYRKFDDNLELLVELSEVVSIKQSIEELVDEYFRIYKINKLRIKFRIETKNVAEKMKKYFDCNKIEIVCKED
ncbi:hypothetical protein [Clostridium estertheticum]|uniref:hypothetical protein n=1 Tax=Clostridium estertheticum TaxID=238834 RepID=UPI001C6F168F|nr:hypothetical protein [Clostridium estertheticum]MBW9151449.1 hypothetical protein [Clostridium estertheticum]WLC83412.1 hypothetical protein KTC97_15125 [Clostridium estertheticum]